MARLAQPWRTGLPNRPTVALPPAPMPPRDGRRPLKRWRWVGVFDERVMLCAATIRIGPLPVAWWAVWDREARTLAERTIRRRGVVDLSGGRVRVDDGPVAIDLALAPGSSGTASVGGGGVEPAAPHHGAPVGGGGIEPAEDAAAVETVSPHGDSYAWTRKQGGVAVRGRVRVAERELVVDARGIVDDSAGYHARRTAWRWSAGIGTAADGTPVAWNLCAGQHDDPRASENTVWVDGVPRAVGVAAFDGLHGVRVDGATLRFAAEAARAHREDALLLASDYEAPFGTFAGALPGVGPITGLGVTERHAARW